ncbi:MAG: GGDEF domain-containing protein [Lachnospiraceae bacterium]|nr:GGDEF domain-containing protein [Lachnospiraceae bacterium]
MEYSKINLLDALMNQDHIKLFWKDVDRRFVGANKAFLDFYEFDDESAIVGKTDEDMGWHIDPLPYQNDELRVLNEGVTISNAEGMCIVKNEVHHIRATKTPIHDDQGNIAGLVGFFVDVTEEVTGQPPISPESKRDGLTGLVNQVGIMDEMLVYEDAYRLRDLDFTCIYLDIDNFHETVEKYGKEYGEELLVDVAECFSQTLGTGGIISRLGSDTFLVLHQIQWLSQVDILLSRLDLALNKVGYMTEPHLAPGVSAGAAVYSEAGDIHQMLELAEARMNENRAERRRDNITSGISFKLN